MMIGAALQTASINDHMFLASRWILGFGIPFAIVSASSLIGELSYEKERPIMTSLFNASWFIGAIVAAGVTYGTFQMKVRYIFPRSPFPITKPPLSNVPGYIDN